MKILDLAEFDLHLDLVPVSDLREQLDMDAPLMGDLKSILVDSSSGKIRHYSSLTPFSLKSNCTRPSAIWVIVPMRKPVSFPETRACHDPGVDDILPT